jgi:hypothetical protein
MSRSVFYFNTVASDAYNSREQLRDNCCALAQSTGSPRRVHGGEIPGYQEMAMRVGVTLLTTILPHGSIDT